MTKKKNKEGNYADLPSNYLVNLGKEEYKKRNREDKSNIKKD